MWKIYIFCCIIFWCRFEECGIIFLVSFFSNSAIDCFIRNKKSGSKDLLIQQSFGSLTPRTGAQAPFVDVEVCVLWLSIHRIMSASDNQKSVLVWDCVSVINVFQETISGCPLKSVQVQDFGWCESDFIYMIEATCDYQLPFSIRIESNAWKEVKYFTQGVSPIMGICKFTGKNER